MLSNRAAAVFSFALLALAFPSILLAADKHGPPKGNARDNSKGAKIGPKQDSTERSTVREQFPDYRSWKSVHDEPIWVPEERATLCMAPVDRGSRRNPHSRAFVSVYVNEKGRDNYLAERPKKFAPGTVIVKEKLNGKDDKHPRGLGVMIKHADGYDDKSGNWQFLYVDEEQHVTTTRSKLTNCINCHKKQSDNDFVFGITKPDESKAAY